MKMKALFSRLNGKFNLTPLELKNTFGSLAYDSREWDDLEVELANAYVKQDESILYYAHRLLNGIYRTMMFVPPAGRQTAEGSVHMAQLRLVLEQAFHQYLLSSTASMRIDSPLGEGYARWLQDFIALHPVADHSAYTRYLADEASIEDIRFYLIQESAIDATTDDFLASLQIGAPNTAKMEIAANYWDEMGEGDHDLLHSFLFRGALRSFNIETRETDDALTLEALICGNLQVMLSLRREFFYYGVGYFAATEQLVPDRFEALKKGWDRVGLSRKGADYHLLHIEVDRHHTERWYRNVISPLAEKSEDTREAMLTGALMRLFTSEMYLTGLVKRFPSKVVPT